MSLSEQERKMLREIEESLLAEDPKFGATVSRAERGLSSGGGHITLRAVAIAVIGLLLLIAGAVLSQQSLWFIAVSIVGFLVMFGAGVWTLRSGGSGPSKKHGNNPAGATAGSSKPGIADRMEQNFNRRFDR